VNSAGNTPPSVSITGPANGSSYTAPATVSITANATDANGTVSKVQFYIGTTLLGTDNTAPYSVSASSLAAGNYAITAKATDNAGATTTSAVVNIVVNSAGNTPPSVSITGPANGSSYTAPATVSITVNATDANGTVSKVEFYIGTTLLGTDNTAPYSVSASSLAAGNYAITAKATDNAGATTTSAVVNISVTANTNTCSGVPQYQQNGGYVAGSRVQNAGSIYECKPFPYSGWCNGASWAYGAGTGAYWSDAWIKIGSCSARLSGELLTEEGLGSYQVSPNPFSAEITIQLPSLNATYTLFVSDTKGKIHQTLSVTNQSVITVGNDLPSGIYFLEITDGTESYVTKIMKY
jgi:chitinase